MSDDVRDPAAPGDGAGDEDFGDWFDREFDRTVITADTDLDRDGDVDPDVDSSSERVDTGADVAAAAGGLGSLVVRRVFRRPVAWWRRPWTNQRIVQVLVTSAILVTTTVVMMLVVHLNPLSPSSDLVFDRTTPTGGDMGAHVWAPTVLHDHFLPNFQLSGWTMDWYGGLPLYRFYMVIPTLAIVALDIVLPYGVAFKLVAVSGPCCSRSRAGRSVASRTSVTPSRSCSQWHRCVSCSTRASRSTAAT